MANCKDSKSKIVGILKKAKESHQNSLKTIVENEKDLSQMFDDLFSACDNLGRQSSKNIEIIEKILASGEDLSGSPEVLEVLESSFNLPSHKFMEEMMIAKRKQLAEAQQSEDLLRIRSLLQSISPLPGVQESNQHPEPTNEAKFEPKFGSSGVLSDEIKYSAVIITNVTHPGHFYIQMVDQDLPLYHQMQVDLQEEFDSTTSKSPSYCSIPTAGTAYALQLGQIWHRVLVENIKKPMAFFVDTGVREEIEPSMEFHFLPRRFMELKAQALKCSLFGVAPLKESLSVYLKGGSDFKLCRCVGAHAVAIFSDVIAGTVGMVRSSGYPKEPKRKEQFAFVTLYVNGETESLNAQVGRTDVARIVSTLKINLPELRELRRKAQLDAEHWSSLMGKKFYAEPELISNVAVDNNDVPIEPEYEEELVLPIEKRFKPKYGSSEVESGCIQYAAVLITHVIHPNHLYAQIEDQDLPLYQQMMRDLQLEFREATKQSPSFCSSPVVGQAYAVKVGHTWRRVIIEKYLHIVGPIVFFVDSGRCQGIKPSMAFHILPQRFMVLKAQAVKFALYGIEGTRQKTKDTKAGSYPKSIYNMLRKYVGTRAVAVIKDLKVGKVGSTPEADGVKEFFARVILYANGAEISINSEIGQSELGRFIKNMEVDVPEHQEMRRKAQMVAEQWKLPASSSFTRREDNAELKTSEDSGIVLLPDEIDGSLEIDTDPVNPLIKEEDYIVLPVTFIGAQSPEVVFFRTSELADTFIKLQNPLYAYFSGQQHGSDIEAPIECAIGYVCAVQSGGKWCRAEVVENENYPDVVLSLLDKDLFVMVHVGEIRCLPMELADIPRTMLHCSLSGIHPASGSSGWNPKVTQHIVRRLKEAKQISIGYQKNLEEDPADLTLPITVYVEECDSNDKITRLINLNEELITLGLGSASWKPLALPKLDETFFAKATWVNEKREIFLQDLRSQSELDSIRQHLNDKYKDTLPAESDLRCVPGDLCIAKRDDSCWYRGIIQQIIGEKATVRFVDYGTVDVVDTMDIRLNLSMKEKPIQVLRCTLYNLNQQLEIGDQEFDMEHVAAMRDEVVDREFKVVVKSLGPPPQVMIYPKL